MDQENWAKVQLPDSGLVLYGSVSQLGPSGIQIALETAPVRPGALATRRQVELHLPLQHAHYRAPAQVVSLEGALLSMVFTKALRPTQRRNAFRLPVRLAVMYRVVRGDGRTGAWQAGTTEDVSAGGMKLVLDKCTDVPRKVEVRFMLPHHTRPILAAARVAHSAPGKDGSVCLGLSFVDLKSDDSVRLVRYIELTRVLPPDE